MFEIFFRIWGVNRFDVMYNRFDVMSMVKTIMLFFKIDKGLYEKLLSNGFTSLSAYCDEVELVTTEIAEEFSIKLIYSKFWQELKKK